MQKKKKSKALSILIGAFLVLSVLGACGESEAPQSAQAVSQPEAAQAGAEPSALPLAESSAEPTPDTQPDPQPTIDPNGEFSIHFIDVGQADAALVSCDGQHMLIDGGNRDDSSLLYSLLQREGITHLRYVVGTHAHEDHIGGIPGALQIATADAVLCPVTDYDSKAFANFKAAADASGGLVVPNVGDTYSLGSASFTVVGVNSDPEDTNNTSIVLRLVYGDTSFLFTGDAERAAEEVILQSGCTLQSDVLKVGHHGSDTSTTYPFLREVMPQYAVISCGADNSYGHPDEGVLSKLWDADAQVYRTDLQGDIFCRSDGKNLTFETKKNVRQEPEPARQTEEESFEQPVETPAHSQISEQPQQAPQPAPAAQGDGSFIGNRNTKKVHHTYCGSLPAEKNRVYFDDLDTALNQGYVRCKKCF